MRSICFFTLGATLLFAPVVYHVTAADVPPTVSLSQIHEAVAKVPAGHPRLLVSGHQLRSLREPAAEGSLKRRVTDHVIREAEQMLAQPPITRTLQGRRLLGESRRCVERVLTLAAAYHLTGRETFARRAEAEMLAAAAFRDWNPSHFLDVGEMTFALAVGYDWLFEKLPESSRKAIRAAMVEKGLKLPFETRHKGWVKARNNWGQVCHGGLTAGALAVLEDEPELAARTIHNAVQHVPLSMEAYAPNGSYPEGPGYWSYGTSYNVVLIAALETALGTDFGLSQAPGFDRTGQYLALVTGPSGLTFNYADGGSRRGPEPALFWFARRYDRYDWLRDEFELFKNKLASAGRLLPLALFWMDEAKTAPENRLPLHWYGDGSVPISIHRSSWDDAQSVFIGFKGGSPSANHGNMDIGSFVLDAQGVRWAVDLGAEGYHGIESRGMNLWDRSQDSDRWTIFRQMNHGHSTLVIDDQLQQANGFGKFVKFSDQPAFAHSVIDLSPVYQGQAGSVQRAIALLPSRCVVVQDELTGLRPGARVRWNMITQGKPESPGPGSPELVLLQGTARLKLTLLSPADLKWSVTDISQPRREWDSSNRDTRAVGFEAVAPGNGVLTLRVLMQPGTARPPEEKARWSGALAEWE